MAEIKISQLSSGTTLDGTEVVPIVQGGATVKVTTQDIADLGGGGGVTSVDMTTPTGLTVTGVPITGAGTLDLALQSGYSIPTTANQSNWTTAYNDSITSANLSYGGASTNLVLNQQDSGTISANLIAGAASAGEFVFYNGSNLAYAPLNATTPLSYNNGTNTFSISQSGASTNGFLSSTDWNTFNGKQASLVSGTNIKTINGSTVLGSGDLVVGGGGAGIHVISKPYSGMGICLNVTQSTNNLLSMFGGNQLYFFPFIPANNVTIDQIVFEVAAASSGGTATVTIYSDLNGKPNSKIYQSASVSTSSTGYKTNTTTQTFTAGTSYWIGFCPSTGGGSFRSTAATSTHAISYTNGIGTLFTQNMWLYPTTSPGSEPTTVSTGSLIATNTPIPNFNLRVA